LRETLEEVGTEHGQTPREEDRQLDGFRVATPQDAGELRES
jgi:hypothetical protein